MLPGGPLDSPNGIYGLFSLWNVSKVRREKRKNKKYLGLRQYLKLSPYSPPFCLPPLMPTWALSSHLFLLCAQESPTWR